MRDMWEKYKRDNVGDLSWDDVNDNALVLKHKILP